MLPDDSLIRLPGLGRAADLAHGFTTRLGGLSRPPHDSLNLSLSTGDDETVVAANLDRLRADLGLKSLAAVYQVHGAEVVVVNGTGHHPLSTLARADAMVTAERGVGLLVKSADCMPVLLADPESGVLGAAHAGWRGLVVDVIGATVRAMIGLGADPGRILAGLGPTLGPCCAEFVNYRTEFPEEMHPFLIENNRFDLWAYARFQLDRAGLRPENVETLALCTRCRADLFYSHRGLGPITGRMGAVIGWRN